MADLCGALDQTETTQYYCTLAKGHPDNGDGTITHSSQWLGPDPNGSGGLPWNYTYSHDWTVPVEPAP